MLLHIFLSKKEESQAAQKAEGQARTGIYYLVLPTCGRGSGLSCHAPPSESAQSINDPNLENVCFETQKLPPSVEKDIDNVASDCKRVIRLEDSSKNYYKSEISSLLRFKMVVNSRCVESICSLVLFHLLLCLFICYLYVLLQIQKSKSSALRTGELELIQINSMYQFCRRDVNFMLLIYPAAVKN